MLQFTLYPLGSALADDHVDPQKRVGLSAILLMVYGVGACIGPMVAGVLMNVGGPATYYLFITVRTAILVWQLRPPRITVAHQSSDAPVKFVAIPDSLQSSPASAALGPRVDPDLDIHMEMVEPNPDVAEPPASSGSASS